MKSNNNVSEMRFHAGANHALGSVRQRHLMKTMLLVTAPANANGVAWIVKLLGRGATYALRSGFRMSATILWLHLFGQVVWHHLLAICGCVPTMSGNVVDCLSMRVLSVFEK